MKFRPCIDIHNGKVKQIVGGSLLDQGVDKILCPVRMKLLIPSPSYRIRGGHIILLNPAISPYYQATKQQALEALAVYPGGLQVGGGIHNENCEEF